MDNTIDKDFFAFGDDDIINIVFFSSGDFGIPTLKALIEEKRYHIKGIVTSNDKVVYNDKRILDIAKENGIPYCIPSNEEELYSFLEPIKDTESEFGDNLYYCVISYKKLSDRILSLVKGRAMNVHASILPFLRGAAPINWAIRLGFKQTGLAAFKLSDKIDQGDVFSAIAVDINENETYDSLFEKLSNKCADFTMGSLNIFSIACMTDSGWSHQPNIGIKSELLEAPKITTKYWDGWLNLSMDEIDRLFRSTSNGLPCKLYIIERDKTEPCAVFDAKIWDYEFIPNLEEGSEGVNWYPTECDGKHYIRVAFGDQVEKVMSIKEIQLSGKKKMRVEEFLRGFKYTRNNEDNYRLVISSNLSD